MTKTKRGKIKKKQTKKYYNYVGFKHHTLEYELKHELHVYGTYLLPYPELDVPREFSWLDVKNHNYFPNISGNFVNPVQNQHSPVYCGSCWIINSLDVYATNVNIYNKIQNVILVVLDTIWDYI